MRLRHETSPRAVRTLAALPPDERATLLSPFDRVNVLPAYRPGHSPAPTPERLVLHWNLEHFDWSGALARARTWWENATDAKREAGEAAYVEMCERATDDALDADAA